MYGDLYFPLSSLFVSTFLSLYKTDMVENEIDYFQL